MKVVNLRRDVAPRDRSSNDVLIIYIPVVVPGRVNFRHGVVAIGILQFIATGIAESAAADGVNDN